MRLVYKAHSDGDTVLSRWYDQAVYYTLSDLFKTCKTVKLMYFPGKIRMFNQASEVRAKKHAEARIHQSLLGVP